MTGEEIVGANGAAPLPPAELERLRKSFEDLRRKMPEWITPEVANAVIREFKLAKRPEEVEIYRDCLTAFTSPEQLILGAPTLRLPVKT